MPASGSPAAFESAASSAWRARHDPVGAERLPQRVHVHLEGARGARRRRLAPDRVDQPVGRDRLVRAEEELGEERARPRAAELQRNAVVVDDLERPEHPELHALRPLPRRLKQSLGGS
jgi:hypothetical protein